MDISRREMYRYMGVRGEPDAATRDLAESVIAELLPKIRPRSFHMVYGVHFPEEDVADMECFRVRSRMLCRNLKGCDRVILFAATIGGEADLLIRRYGRVSVPRGLAMQAASAAAIEAYCNEENERLREAARKEGYFLRPRFSPGYGDFDLSFQRQIFEALKAQKTVGITLTESLMMLPSKSVTAVIGMGREETHCVPEGCEACGRTDCEFRRL